MFIHDVRDQLVRSKTVPQTLRGSTRFVTLHWNGPSIGHASDIDLLKADARYHVYNKGWDGISYHYGVGRELEGDTGNTKVYRNRDYMAKLAHSGVTQGNNESLSVLVIHGEGDSVSNEQFGATYELLRTLDIEPRYILGHQEWPRATACPGAKMRRWLADFRAKHSDTGVHRVTVLSPVGNVRDEANVLSYKMGTVTKGQVLTGRWVLGSPVKGDSLWLELSGANKAVPDSDGVEYVHGSVLDTASYVKRTW